MDFRPKVSTRWIPKCVFSFKESPVPARVMDPRHLRAMLTSQQKRLMAVRSDSRAQELVFFVLWLIAFGGVPARITQSDREVNSSESQSLLSLRTPASLINNKCSPFVSLMCLSSS